MRNVTAVKICGLGTAEHARAAVEAGADLIGFIFAPARRQVSPELVAAIAREIRAMPGGRDVLLTGVFVNEAPARVLEIAERCGLDAIQLSGDEPLADLGPLSGRPLIKTVRLVGASEQEWLAAAERGAVRLHVDAHVQGSYGGTGVLSDWEGAAELAGRFPIVLAGGLTPDNVAAAVRQVRPYGVDVSSGVETGGIKDAEKIYAFVSAVRAANP
jgi:phosphoribosylanthranilate isomerase